MTLKTKNCLFQYSNLEAFDQLHYDGTLSIKELKKFGNFGLGCFNALNGELIAFDDQFFHATSDGKVKKTSEDQLVSCVYISSFNPILEMTKIEGLAFSELSEILKNKIDRCGEPFYAIKIKGHFASINVRSVPPQKKPYPTIPEIVEQQALFDYNDIDATMIGFYFPSYLDGLTYPGFHLHFVSHDKTRGGHVLNFHATEANIYVDPIDCYHHVLPDYARAYRQ